MHLSTLFTLAGASVGALSRGSLPNIVGSTRLSAELVAARRWAATPDLIEGSTLNRRNPKVDDNENTKGRCGASFENASCAPGYCCSSAG